MINIISMEESYDLLQAHREALFEHAVRSYATNIRKTRDILLDELQRAESPLKYFVDMFGGRALASSFYWKYGILQTLIEADPYSLQMSIPEDIIVIFHEIENLIPQELSSTFNDSYCLGVTVGHHIIGIIESDVYLTGKDHNSRLLGIKATC
jgi:hypothetical protein